MAQNRRVEFTIEKVVGLPSGYLPDARQVLPPAGALLPKVAPRQGVLPKRGVLPRAKKPAGVLPRQGTLPGRGVLPKAAKPKGPAVPLPKR